MRTSESRATPAITRMRADLTSRADIIIYYRQPASLYQAHRTSSTLTVYTPLIATLDYTSVNRLHNNNSNRNRNATPSGSCFGVVDRERLACARRRFPKDEILQARFYMPYHIIIYCRVTENIATAVSDVRVRV